MKSVNETIRNGMLSQVNRGPETDGMNCVAKCTLVICTSLLALSVYLVVVPHVNVRNLFLAAEAYYLATFYERDVDDHQFCFISNYQDCVDLDPRPFQFCFVSGTKCEQLFQTEPSLLAR